MGRVAVVEGDPALLKVTTVDDLAQGRSIAVTVRAVVFDVGETLVDESRTWGLQADELGVSQAVFFAALGAVIERRQHHRRVFDEITPGSEPAEASFSTIAKRISTPTYDRVSKRSARPVSFSRWRRTNLRRPKGFSRRATCRSTSSRAPRAGESRSPIRGSSSGWLRSSDSSPRRSRTSATASTTSRSRCGSRSRRGVHPARALGLHPCLLARGRSGADPARIARRIARRACALASIGSASPTRSRRQCA